MPAKTCSMCANPVKRAKSIDCSLVCRNERKLYERSLITASWIRGEIQATGCNGNDGAGLAKWARDYMLDECGHECTLCGWDTPHPRHGTPPLEIDHIDGDRTNNHYTNIRVLCPNCHALTPTHRGNKNALRA